MNRWLKNEQNGVEKEPQVTIWSALGPFWTLPTAFLSGTAAAGGIALINSIGNVGGFVGPMLLGSVKDATGSFAAGLVTTCRNARCEWRARAGGQAPRCRARVAARRSKVRPEGVHWPTV